MRRRHPAMPVTFRGQTTSSRRDYAPGAIPVFTTVAWQAAFSNGVASGARGRDSRPAGLMCGHRLARITGRDPAVVRPARRPEQQDRLLRGHQPFGAAGAKGRTRLLEVEGAEHLLAKVAVLALGSVFLSTGHGGIQAGPPRSHRRRFRKSQQSCFYRAATTPHFGCSPVAAPGRAKASSPLRRGRRFLTGQGPWTTAPASPPGPAERRMACTKECHPRRRLTGTPAPTVRQKESAPGPGALSQGVAVSAAGEWP